MALTAVDDEDLAGNVCCGGREEEDGGVGAVLLRSHYAERNCLARVVGRGREAAHAFGVADWAGVRSSSRQVEEYL